MKLWFPKLRELSSYIIFSIQRNTSHNTIPHTTHEVHTMATPLSGAAAPRLTSLLTRNLRPHLHRQSRLLSTRHPPPPTTSRPAPVGPPRTRDRGPKSKEDTQTDFGQMDMLASIPPPSTAVDACLPRGFALDSGVRVEGGGVLLVGGEALVWRPWNLTGKKRLFNGRGQLEVGEEGWGVLRGVWPKPGEFSFLAHGGRRRRR